MARELVAIFGVWFSGMAVAFGGIYLLVFAGFGGNALSSWIIFSLFSVSTVLLFSSLTAINSHAEEAWEEQSRLNRRFSRELSELRLMIQYQRDRKLMESEI